MIKKMNSEDVLAHKQEIYNLMQIDFISTYGFEAEQQFVESKIDALPNHLTNKKAFVFGFFENEILTSFLWAYPIATPAGNVMHIAYIAVSEVDRNKGIGSNLLDAIEQEASEHGLKTVELIVGANNRIARSFYKKNRYEEGQLVLKKII